VRNWRGTARNPNGTRALSQACGITLVGDLGKGREGGKRGREGAP